MAVLSADEKYRESELILSCWDTDNFEKTPLGYCTVCEFDFGASVELAYLDLVVKKRSRRFGAIAKRPSWCRSLLMVRISLSLRMLTIIHICCSGRKVPRYVFERKLGLLTPFAVRTI